MTPPLFVWKPGVLDVFDSAADLAERYAVDELSGDDVVCCDAEGRTLRARAEPDGTMRIGCDPGQTPQPERLATLLRGYLERGQVPAETLAALTLPELIERAYPCSVPTERTRQAKGKRKPRWPTSRQQVNEQDVGRLVDAFGIGLIMGIIGADVGFAMRIILLLNFPSPQPPGFAAIGILFEELFTSTIVGAAVGGSLAYFWALSQRGVLGSVHAEKIGGVFVGLLAVLIAIGVAVACIGFIFVAWGGE